MSKLDFLVLGFFHGVWHRLADDDVSELFVGFIKKYNSDNRESLKTHVEMSDTFSYWKNRRTERTDVKQDTKVNN
jgi:hypothetical protein